MTLGSYGWITFAQARQQLAQRLDDPNFVHWSDAELKLYIIEALTEWQSLTGYWRDRGTFNLTAGAIFYDLPTLLTDSGGNLMLEMATTDAQVIAQMEYMLLEPPTPTFWTGSTQFTLDELTSSLQATRDNFLSETGAVITHSLVAVPPAPIGRFPVDDHVIDVRRVAWLPTAPPLNNYIYLQDSGGGTWQIGVNNIGILFYAAAAFHPVVPIIWRDYQGGSTCWQLGILPNGNRTTTSVPWSSGYPTYTVLSSLGGYIFSLGIDKTGGVLATFAGDLQSSQAQIPLWMSDEFSAGAIMPGWNLSPGDPESYSIVAPPPLQVQLIPPPISNGQCDLLTVNSGATLDPTVGVPLGIPTNFVWAVKWGALADLLSQDGEPRDDFRAGYCRQRYEEACEVARMMPVVVTAALSDVQVFPQAVGELDAFRPTWASSTGLPDAIACAGQNLIAVAPPPDAFGPYSVRLDVVRNAVVPVADGDFLQIGREWVNTVLDEAFHIALFKSGGSEFADTVPLHQSFVKAAATQNDKLKAMSIYLNAMQAQSTEETKIRPRRESDAEVTA